MCLCTGWYFLFDVGDLQSDTAVHRRNEHLATSFGAENGQIGNAVADRWCRRFTRSSPLYLDVIVQRRQLFPAGWTTEGTLYTDITW